MRRSPAGKVFQTLIIFYIISFLVLTAYSVIHVITAGKIIPSFRAGYAFRAGIHLFLANLIPIHAAAILFVFSLFLSSTVGKETGRPFHSMVSGAIVLLIALTGIYTFTTIFTEPLLRRKIEETEILSDLAAGFLVKASQYEDQELFEQVVIHYNLYLSIDSENEDIQRTRLGLIEKYQASGLSTQVGDNEHQNSEGRVDSPSMPAIHETVKSDENDEIGNIRTFLQKADSYLENEDYLSAFYYANLALNLDKENIDAELIRNNALRHITGYQLTKSDREAATLFETKLKGFNALENDDFISAYYTFKRLNLEHPDDSETERFLKLSMEGMQNISFFYDEVEKSLIIPGIEDIVFINKKDEIQREIIHIDRVISMTEGFYFHGIEIINFNAGGRINFHLRAPFGKLINGHINMNCRDRDNPDPKAEYLPFYRVGSAGETGFSVPLNRPIQYLQYLSLKREGPSKMGLGELWDIRNPYDLAGYNRQEVEIEILMRLLKPFLFLIISLFSVSIGWVYRGAFTAKPPLIAYLLMPVFPLVTAYTVRIILYAHRILLGYTMISFGFRTALAALLALEALFLIIGLLLLAGQISD